MKGDVVIPVYKPGTELLELLDRLKRQTVSLGKIILMNTGQQFLDALTAGTGFAEKYPEVEVHHLARKEFDHGGTRHQGVRYTDGDVFVTMTQDAMPAREDLVEKLVDALREGVAVAYARQLPRKDSGVLERISREFNYPAASQVKNAGDMERLGVKTFFCSNVCAAYRRDIYEELGGFIRHTIFNEDMIYAAGAVQAGYSVAYVAGAEVIHSHTYTNLQQLRRNFDLGVSQADHPEVFSGISSESEGKKLVAQTWRRLGQEGCRILFPGFCMQCAFKYAGYFLGKHYKGLPRKWVLAISTNRAYWEGGRPGLTEEKEPEEAGHDPDRARAACRE